MKDYDGAAMIALIPTTSDWCKIDLPHMTLVYAGLIADRNQGDFNAMAKDAASIAMLARPISLKVIGVEVFGTDEKVDALRLHQDDTLRAMRNFVESWNASEHSFNPHVTVGPVGSASALPPMYLTFDRIMVGWGDEYLTFLFNR